MKFDKIIEENSKLDAFKRFRDEELKAQKAKKLRNEVVKFFNEFDDFMVGIYNGYLEDKEFVSWLQNVRREGQSVSADAANDVSNIYGFLRVLTDAQEELSNTLENPRTIPSIP
jgi:hypothetical protein